VAKHGAKTGDYGITGSPLIVGDAVLYNACAKGVALQRATGEKIWASAAGTSGFASPVAVGPSVALFTASSLSILDPATGRETASFGWQTSFDCNAADPVAFDGQLFITSGWDKGCALLKLDGGRLSEVWRNTELRSQIASPVYLDGHLYGIDDNTPNGQLKCLEAKTGKVKWARKGGFGNLLAAGGRLLSIDKMGALVVVAADPSGYKELARVPVLGSKAKNWIAPVLASLGEDALFFSSTVLTAFNDNALITYLATLVPHLDESLRVAIVEGAVTGGGLTVIANAPNPAGQALLGRFFNGSILPIGLFLGALLPTIVAIIAFRLL